MHRAEVVEEGAGRALSSTLLTRLCLSLQVGKVEAAAPTGSMRIRIIILTILKHILKVGVVEVESLPPLMCPCSILTLASTELG
jgi:hypothetical protein